LEAYHQLGCTSLYIGELAAAHTRLEQGIALYDPQQHGSHTFLYAHDPGVCCLCNDAFALWLLGHPNQALKRTHQALRLAQELSHPLNRALALYFAAVFHQYCQEVQVVQERAEACITLCTEHGVPFSSLGTILRGWALAEQGEGEGIDQVRQGLAVLRAAGSELWRPYYLALLAEAYGKVGQTEEGLNALAEALAAAGKTGERWYEAELYRLKGQLTLQQSEVRGPKSEV
jgi:predicted ATPase